MDQKTIDKWQDKTPKDIPDRVKTAMLAAFVDELEKIALPMGYLKSLKALPVAHPLRKATSVVGKLNPAEKAKLQSIFKAHQAPTRAVPGKDLMAAIRQAKKTPGSPVSV